MTKETTTTTLLGRLFEAGAHFGFSKSRRHPSVQPYLFATKQGTDIFDLEKTETLLGDAKTFIAELGTKGKRVLFVGTKEEIADLVRATADALTMPFITNRWIGGILTNFSEIKKRIDRMTMLGEQRESGELDRKYTKKERLLIDRELEKLAYNFGGIKAMDALPAAIVVVDPRHESIVVAEARQMNIPTIAVMSSDCDLSLVTKPILVNDANRSSVGLILEELRGAYSEGRTHYTPKSDVRPQKSKTETA